MSPVTIGGSALVSAVAGSQTQVTVSTSAVGVTVPSGASYAFLQVTGNAIYLTEEGTTPSATRGFSLSAGDGWVSFEPGRIRMIRQSADAVVNVCFYG